MRYKVIHLLGWTDRLTVEGLLLCIRNDIPAKRLPLFGFGNIECIILGVTVSDKKWLLGGTYNPDTSQISNHLSTLSRYLCHYSSSYENIVILGDFNGEYREEAMEGFCSLFCFSSLIKDHTCFKSVENPTCVDLILTNRSESFQNSMVVETGLSDFHKVTVTVLITSFRKKPPKVIQYRNYKKCSHANFRNELGYLLNSVNICDISNDDFVTTFMDILNKHAPIKKKYIRANDNPFITKELRKEHMSRSRLRNKYYKYNTDASALAYKKQRNKCVSLLKKATKTYFGNLNPSVICDNKKFWKTIKPLFSE